MLSPSRWSLGRPLARHVRLASSTVSAQRRGRNLTERYRSLESTTQSISQQSVLDQSTANAPKLQTNELVNSTANTVADFVIPQVPRAPADDECCMSGCAVCVYDLYEEELSAYKDAMTTLRAALSARHIPETEWPAHIRTSNGTHTTSAPTGTEKFKGAVLDAFEEMERALKEKREKRASVEAEKKARGDVLVGDGERVELDLQAVCEGIRWAIFPNR